MPVFKVKHITHYTYNSPAVDCTNQIMLFPIQDHLQNVLNHKITITNNPPVEIFIDYFGNRLGMFSLIEPHSQLEIVSEAEVITYATKLPEVERPATDQWEQLSVLCEQFPFIDFLQHEAFEKVPELEGVISTLRKRISLRLSWRCHFQSSFTKILNTKKASPALKPVLMKYGT